MFSQKGQSKTAIQNVSPIIGIQFSIMSPDEIRKSSVAHITDRNTYDNNRPVVGGPFDARMGVLEPGLICPTDGLDYMQTPGYFGHIELARPVFYIQYLTTIRKILSCICIKCSKLLIDKESNRRFMDMKPDKRWGSVFQYCSKVKRCGDDTHDGCGCLQPKRIKKQDIATIIAEWESNETEETGAGAGGGAGGGAEGGAGAGAGAGAKKSITMHLTPEVVLKIFRRISDEDVSFMGFSPQFSRPDWMICQVLAVPPPAVRPSIKMDGQQRSEDDISHILVNIIKHNKTLQEKINEKAAQKVIDGWHDVLQYYIATQINNNIPGVGQVAQRSGRPLKSIMDRLNGKGGRVRGNLMGKRVDFSARSVITPDPNLSIRELGIPLKIAKNITKPISVNEMNKNFLLKLVRNGPDEYPGAKILEKRNGENISLRYADRENIRIENGDIVHRHIMDGDGVLFNRQPTLHRMSMMCHIAKVMYQGDTFRMNVGDTKPYNADFDGDEMNLHMPQDEESEAELKNLAAVPFQIISPANNQSIIGIFQDSLLGSYQFTRVGVKFDNRAAMNLLMALQTINESLFTNTADGVISNFEILSQIMPPITLKYKTKQFKDGDDYNTSNNVLEIRDGKYTRGQLDKAVLGSGTNGLIHRTCNDFNNMTSAKFIDDLQNIITEYMKVSAYSVGISDLIANAETNNKIANVITSKKTDVNSLIDQLHIGVFDNKTGKTNDIEFENQVSNILNKAINDAGKIGIESLSKDNRFVTMVTAGSKGSEINISQMTSCLGQQAIDGKRIPYGFDSRTLPHFTKYDDSPDARGFVESSFISGLRPEELFFHAMAGRIGLIDTAVKTSTTGYIQRRLIKGLEDLKIGYDMSVRNNKERIVQFSYGDDGFDTIKVENQVIPIVAMSLEEIYAHYYVSTQEGKDGVLMSVFTKTAVTRMKKHVKDLEMKTKFYTDMMIQYRDEIVKNVFKMRDNKGVHMPVCFTHIINNVQGMQNITKNSMVDITPIDVYDMIEEKYKELESLHYAPPTDLFKAMYYYYLSPKDLLVVKRFNKKALTILLDTIVLMYKRAIVAPGEMVGMIAAQSIGEPTTQLTLNTFHSAGVASKSNVTRGVPRIEEILSLSENTKNPSLTIYMKKDEETDKDLVRDKIPSVEITILAEIVEMVEICFDPDDMNTLIEQDKEVMTQYFEFEKMVDECMTTMAPVGGGDGGEAGEGEELVEELVSASVSSSTPLNKSKSSARGAGGGAVLTEAQQQQQQQAPNEKSKWIIRMTMNKEEMLDRKISMDDVHFALINTYGSEVTCMYADYNSDNLVFRIRLNNIITNSKKKNNNVLSLDQSDQIYILKNFQDNMLNNIVLRGVKGLSNVLLRKITDSVIKVDGAYTKKETWVLDTTGTNLLTALALDYIDVTRTISNDIQEIYNVLGIEAARVAIFTELSEVLEFDNTYINYHHLIMLADRMTASANMVSIFRHGINNDDIGPIAKASFEETPEMFLKAARHAELDEMRGVSANVMCGQEGYFGTSCFQVLLDMNKMMKFSGESKYNVMDANDEIDAAFEMENPDDVCSIHNLSMNATISNIKKENLGNVMMSYDAGF
jgi:DNA-directed RNA polymerase II subunit RPB1